MRMFGTNGVRGIANEYLSCELALRMGRCIGKVLGPRIAMACDTRVTSDMIRSALSAGLMSVGTDVLDLGVVPTPALQLYIKEHHEITGGVMITASHNPPEFNGIKCISGDGTECPPEEERRIEDLYDEDVPTVGWKDVGSILRISNAAEDYVRSIVSKVDSESIKEAGFTVVVDCANGASVETTPMLMKELGVRAITINGNPQGEFPGHPSEPTEDNLSALKKMVVDLGADLGIAHDGDADRCVFIAGDGRYISGDAALAILSRHLLKKEGGNSVTVTVATSAVVESTVASCGGDVVYTAVGSPIVSRAMRDNGSIFGGEENGGLIFASHQYCRDGAMGAAVMLECILSEGPLPEQLDSLPRYYTVKKTAYCPDELKQTVTDEISSNHADCKINRMDGLRIDFDDGWVLLRPSGTEPKYRIYSESRDRDTAEQRAQVFLEEFESTLSRL